MRAAASRSRRLAGALAVAALPAAAGASDWSFNASLTLKETFDSNVYLQDARPRPDLPRAVRPRQESFVTSVTPSVEFAFKPSGIFNVSGSYAPEVVEFHSETTESHVAHRAELLFDGTAGGAAWQMENRLTWIDGEREGLTFGAPGGAPALGGFPVRDRREALIYRNSFSASFDRGGWRVRPALSTYIHDFRVFLRDPALFPGYLNSLDRSDVNFGFDAGRKTAEDRFAFLAYRFGWQRAQPLAPGGFDHSNEYQRLLAGFEGRVTDWFRMCVSIGPEWRSYNRRTPPGFDRDPVNLFLDGEALLALGRKDTVTLAARQFEQPGTGAPAVFEDMTFDLVWERRFNTQFGGAVGFRVRGGDWEPPTRREDWIYTASAALTWARDERLGAELAWSYDWAESEVPNTPGREFTRHLVSLSARYAF